MTNYLQEKKTAPQKLRTTDTNGVVCSVTHTEPQWSDSLQQADYIQYELEKNSCLSHSDSVLYNSLEMHQP